MASIRVRNETAKVEKKEQALQLRKLIATKALGFIKWQLIATNIFFGFYLVCYLSVLHLAVPPAVMVGWLSSTIVEVIGILWVIARSLFPFHDKFRDHSSERSRVKK